MRECDVCKIIENKDSFNLIYEDSICIAIIHEIPAVKGHVILFPKEHYPIFEEVPKKVINHIFKITNKISTAIFDSMSCQGTNIIINNGITAGQELPHFIINIIPRFENDNINFEWTPNKKSDSELDITQTIIKQALNAKKEIEQKKEITNSEPEPIHIQNKQTNKVFIDQMTTRMHRIP